LAGTRLKNAEKVICNSNALSTNKLQIGWLDKEIEQAANDIHLSILKLTTLNNINLPLIAEIQ
jgi:hypothetical protein